MQVLNAPLLTGELGQQLKQNQHTQNSTIHERPSPVLDCTTHTNSIARSQAGQPTESLEYGGSKSRLNTRRSLRRRECQRTGPSESIQWRRRMERSSWTRHPDCRRSSLRVKKADWRKIEVAQKTFEHPQNKQYREALFILFPSHLTSYIRTQHVGLSQLPSLQGMPSNPVLLLCVAPQSKGSVEHKTPERREVEFNTHATCVLPSPQEQHAQKTQ